MKRELLKAAKTGVVALFVVILIFSLIVSQDNHHLESCHEEECIYCTIILMAKKIMGISVSFCITVVIGISIYLFLLKLHKEYKIFVQLSLVFQKVQFNE